MLNIVFFVNNYIYGAEANGICVRSVAEELVRRGCGVTVVSRRKNANDPAIETVSGVKVLRVDAGEPYNVEMPQRLIKLTEKLARFSSGIKTRILRAPFTVMYLISSKQLKKKIKKRERNLLLNWPAAYPTLTKRYDEESYRFLRNEQPDVIVGVYSPTEEAQAAIALKKRYPNATSILYSLDAFTGRWAPSVDGDEDAIKRRIERLEKRMFRSFDKLFVLESHRKHYEHGKYEKYRKKFVYVDIPYIENIDETDAEHVFSMPPRAVFTGYMGVNASCPDRFIELLKRPDVNLRLEIYGYWDEHVERIITESGLLGNKVNFFGSKDREEIAKIQRSADFLITLGNEYPCMIPCKIFEYMRARRPIIGVHSIPDDAARPYIERYPDSLLLDTSGESEDENARRLYDFMNLSQRPRIKADELLRLFPDNRPESTADRIMDVAKQSTGQGLSEAVKNGV